jgi:hypothetical protein
VPSIVAVVPWALKRDAVRELRPISSAIKAINGRVVRFSNFCNMKIS